jgi:uncharacterized membrane protein YkoI
MTRMSRIAALLVALCLAGMLPGQAAARDGRHGPPDSHAQANDHRGGGGDKDEPHQSRVSLDEAVAIVRARYEGKVIRAETQGSDDHPVHEIRILSPDGRVFTVHVDGVTGRIQ